MRPAGEQSAQDRGFTLVELLVVVIIIGVLAGIAIPVFLNQREKGYDAQTKSDLRNVATLQETQLETRGAYATTVTDDPEPATPDADTIYYERSPNAGLITTHFVNANGVIVTSPKTIGFCLEAESASGTSYAYNSVLGGAQGANTTC